jgi:DNA-directed RNA polymerase subunit RPC12/RpoP
MAIVKCPECGERVKYLNDEVKLRCPECGVKVRVPDDEEEERSRSRHKKKAPNKLLIPAIVTGLAAVIAVVAILLVRGRGDNDNSDRGDGGSVEVESAKVTVEHYTKIVSSMELAEIEQILGGSRLSSARDAGAAFLDVDRNDQPKWMIQDPGLPGNSGLEWRRWRGNGFTVSVAFIDTKYGKLSAYGLGLSDDARWQGSFNDLGIGVAGIEAAYAERLKIRNVRRDTKWLRGARSHAAILGEWRDAQANGWVFAAGGKLKPLWSFFYGPHETQPPTYRFSDDKHLLITHPFGDMPADQTFEYYILGDELVLIDVTAKLYPHSTYNAQFFYRMPPTPGSLAHTKLFQPLLANLTAPGDKPHWESLGKLTRFDDHALPLIRELARTASGEKKSSYEGAILSVEAHLHNEKERKKAREKR